MLLLHLLPTPYCYPKPCFPIILSWVFPSRSAGLPHTASFSLIIHQENSLFPELLLVSPEHAGKLRPPHATARPGGYQARHGPTQPSSEPRRLHPAPRPGSPREGKPGNPPAGCTRTAGYPRRRRLPGDRGPCHPPAALAPRKRRRLGRTGGFGARSPSNPLRSQAAAHSPPRSPAARR